MLQAALSVASTSSCILKSRLGKVYSECPNQRLLSFEKRAKCQYSLDFLISWNHFPIHAIQFSPKRTYRSSQNHNFTSSQQRIRRYPTKLQPSHKAARSDILGCFFFSAHRKGHFLGPKCCEICLSKPQFFKTYWGQDWWPEIDSHCLKQQKLLEKEGSPQKATVIKHPSPSMLSALQRSNFTILQWLGSPDNLRNGVVFLILSLSYQLYRWCFSSATAAMTQMHHKNVSPVCHLPLILQWQDTWTALHFPADPSPGGRIRSESGGHLYKLHTLQFHYHSKKPTNQPNLL